MEFKKFEQILVQLTAKVKSQMRDNLVKSGKGNSRLIQNLDVVIIQTEDGYQIQDRMADYAIYVDQGRRPGKQPPLGKIEDWCRSKSIPKEAAYPIARKIGKEGIHATNFMKPLRTMSELIVNNTGKYIAEDIIGVLNEKINQINK